MITLLQAETSRLVARRGVWGTLAGGLVVVALMCVALAMATRPPDGEAVEQGRHYYQMAHADWVANARDNYDACMAAVPVEEQGGCARALDEPRESDFVPQPLSFADGTKAAAEAGAIVGSLLSLVMAATFWGAEYRHRTLATWLTFVPGRTRVWASKFAVVAAGGALVTAVCEAIGMAAVAGAVAVLQGGAAASGPLGGAFALAGRGVGLGALFALLGGGMAVLFRQTLAPVLAPLGYFLAQVFLGGFANLPGFAGITVWLPETNIRAYLEYGATYIDPVFRATDMGMQVDSIERTLAFGNGLTYLLVAVGVVAVGSYVSFRRRDVA